MIGEVEPLVLFEQYDEEESSLLTHNQELVRSGRDRAAKLLCIQQISHWTSAEYEIFRNELNIDVERSAGVTSLYHNLALNIIVLIITLVNGTSLVWKNEIGSI